MRLLAGRRGRGACLVAAALVAGQSVAGAQVSRVKFAAAPVEAFAAYVTPGECAPIAPRMEQEYWNTHRPDTVAQAPRSNPARRETIADARRCVARYQIAKTSVRDLPGLGRAYLMAEQWAQADSAFRRWLKFLAPRPADEQRWALVQIVDLYASAQPAQLEQALAYAARLDSLGAAAAPERLMAHLTVLPVVVHMDSVALQEREVAAALRAGRQLAGDSLKRYLHQVRDANVALAELYARRGEGARARQTIDSAAAALSGLCPFLTWPAADYLLLGLPATPIQGTYWFNDSTGGHRPAAGRRSLIVFPELGCTGTTCFSQYSVLRRLRARYPDLDVTLVARTRGSLGARLLAPAAEAEENRRYFLDEQQLPAALGVWETVFRRRALDRGLVPEPNPNEGAYWPVQSRGGGIAAALVDRAGKIRMYDRLAPETEIRWRNVIAEMP